jgi:hypothetical protein
MKRLKVSIGLVCILALSSACVTNRFSKPISTYQKSVDASIGVIGKYYDGMNSYERRLYLQGILLNPKEEVLFTDAQGKLTPLAGRIFSPESVKARLDALALINLYAKRLADLAGSDAPTKFAENTKVLSDNLVNLSGTFSTLAGAGADKTASKFITPIGSLVGLVGQIYLQEKRDAALKAAIEQGDPVVTQILDLIKDDLVGVISPQILTGAKQLLADRVNSYNQNRTTMSSEERRKALDEIAAAAQEYDATILFNPANLLQAMKEAHQALVKFARAPKEPKTFSDLVAALETFAGRAETAAQAIHQLAQNN